MIVKMHHLANKQAKELVAEVVEEAAEEAKSICAICPVRLSCLEHALSSRERDGVWGGTTEKERRRIIRHRRRTA